MSDDKKLTPQERAEQNYQSQQRMLEANAKLRKLGVLADNCKPNRHVWITGQYPLTCEKCGYEVPADEMTQPGRFLDYSIATKVLKHLNVHWNDHSVEEPGTEHIGGLYLYALVYQPYDDIQTLFRELPAYSEELSASNELINYLSSLGYSVELTTKPDTFQERFFCKIEKLRGESKTWTEKGNSLSHALCLCALSLPEFKV